MPSGGKVGGFIASPPQPGYGEPSQPPYMLPPGVDSKTLTNSFLQVFDSLHYSGLLCNAFRDSEVRIWIRIRAILFAQIFIREMQLAHTFGVSFL